MPAEVPFYQPVAARPSFLTIRPGIPSVGSGAFFLGEPSMRLVRLNLSLFRLVDRRLPYKVDSDNHTFRHAPMPNTEGHKLYFDLVKHLTTLSSGSIALFATLGEKLFDKPRALWLVAISLTAFFLSILAGVASMLLTSREVLRDEPYNEHLKYEANSITWSIYCFIVGFGAFLVFIIANITR